MREEKKTSYTVDESGIIFIISRSDIVDSAGAVTHRGAPHRAPIEPGSKAPDDAKARELVKIFYTPGFVAAYKAAVQTEADKQEKARAMTAPAGKRNG